MSWPGGDRPGALAGAGRGRRALPWRRLVNPSTAFGSTFCDELIRCGLREVVLAPGSRSTPLAMAFANASQQERIRLHVRIDERSASFTALGLAKASRTPVAVLCTSGTAAANFHPAVIEASESAVPLIVLTADRPPELRGTGANQTIDQIKLYGAAVRWFCEAGPPEARPGMAAYWRSLACQAWARAAGLAGGLAGPVHLNLPLRDPLVPDAARRTGRSRWTDVAAGSRGPVSRTGRAAVSSSCPGPSGACWSAGTATTTRCPWSSWPNGRLAGAGRALVRSPARTECAVRLPVPARHAGVRPGSPARPDRLGGPSGLSRGQSRFLGRGPARRHVVIAPGSRALGGPAAGRHRRRGSLRLAWRARETAPG